MVSKEANKSGELIQIKTGQSLSPDIGLSTFVIFVHVSGFGCYSSQCLDKAVYCLILRSKLVLFKIPTSVLQENTTAVLMLCAKTQRGLTTAIVNQDITETEKIAKVNFFLSY